MLKLWCSLMKILGFGFFDAVSHEILRHFQFFQKHSKAAWEYTEGDTDHHSNENKNNFFVHSQYILIK